MAYNFEATFVQPLLTQLDNGLIKGADDWTNSITRAYINTIKAGLPQGTPPTLPAPGLAVPPSPPPPFPIGAAPFTTADTRSQQMSNVIRAYFLAKSVALDKGAITGLAATIKQLIKKLRTRYSQAKSFILQIKAISEQLKNVPKLLRDIVAGFGDIVRDLIRDISTLELDLNKFRTELDPTSFEQVFGEEVRLIKIFKSFTLTNVAGIRDISLFVSTYGTRTNSLLAITSNQNLAKRYIQSRLFSIAKILIALADGVTDPTKIVNILRSIERGKTKIKLLIQKIKRFDLYVRLLQPKLRLLERKRDQKIKEIKDYIQPRLENVKKKFEEKINELVKKIESSKAATLYKKASKLISDLKKQHKSKIKKVRQKITIGTKILKKTNTLIGKSTTLLTALEREFIVLQKEIVAYTKTVSRIVGQVASFAEVNDYLSQAGLSQLSQIAAILVVQTQIDIKTFKYFFEKRSKRMIQFANQFSSLRQEIDQITQLSKELVGGQPIPSFIARLSNWLEKRIISLKDVFSFFNIKIKPVILKIEKWVRKQVNKLKKDVEQKLVKFQENLTAFAANLVPLKSDVQDKKDKAAVLEDKIKKIKNKIAQLKRLITLGGFISKMSTGATKVASNFAQGKLKLSENNNAIDQILDGWYGFKSEGKSASIQAALLLEKTAYKNKFKGLVVIEAIVMGLTATFTDITKSGFVRDLEQIKDTISSNVPGRQVLESILSICKNPPKNINDLKRALNTIALGSINDARAKTIILGLERKYLLRSRALIGKICNTSTVKGTKAEKTLIKIKSAVDKNQSFILLALNLLRQELKDFGLLVYNKILKNTLQEIKTRLVKLRQKIENQFELEQQKLREKLVNADAAIMSFTFGLAARLFWTGASWTGPTGTQHTVLNIGPFTPVKALSTDGASAMIREMARGFEAQLNLMQGLLIPPSNTGIPPLTFTGYK